MILLHLHKNNLSIVRHLGGEILHFECYAYRVTVIEASDLKLSVGGVYQIYLLHKGIQ